METINSKSNELMKQNFNNFLTKRDTICRNGELVQALIEDVTKKKSIY